MTEQEKREQVTKEYDFISERLKALGANPTPIDYLFASLSIRMSVEQIYIILSQPILQDRFSVNFAERKKEKEIERAEFSKELSGLFLSLGYLNSNNGTDFCAEMPELEQAMAWELGIHPTCELSGLLALFKKYLENKNNE
jgi:hypothetical protein